jgi:hypothetical protein
MKDSTATRRSATQGDLLRQELAAEIHEVQADYRREQDPAGARRHAAKAKAHGRSVWLIRRSMSIAKRPGSRAEGVPRTSPRARGAGRAAGHGASRRSSARSGDSGSDSESSEPPPGGRLCECGCGQDISHRAAQALYLNDTHACADRQRRKRKRDRPQLAERPGVDRHRSDPYSKLDRHEYEKLLSRAEAGCRCNGHHIADGDGGCSKCGRWLAGARYSLSFIRAGSAETRRVRKAAA